MGFSLLAASPDFRSKCFNPCKAKHLTNIRSQGEGKGIQLEASLRMSLERAIEYIDIDEYVEATPKSLRFRKRIP